MQEYQELMQLQQNHEPSSQVILGEYQGHTRVQHNPFLYRFDSQLPLADFSEARQKC